MVGHEIWVFTGATAAGARIGGALGVGATWRKVETAPTLGALIREAIDVTAAFTGGDRAAAHA
jgi:hypothetical protein